MVLPTCLVQETEISYFGRSVSPVLKPRLWSGKSPVPSLLNITDGKATADLPRGLYLADIPAAALREGFEVNGSGSAEVVVSSSYSGPRVSPPATGASFHIQIDPKDDGAEIFIVDDHFELVERRKGRLKLSLSYGIYKFKVRLARDLHEQIVLVDHDGPVSIMAAPLLTSSAIIQEVILPNHKAILTLVDEHSNLAFNAQEPIQPEFVEALKAYQRHVAVYQALRSTGQTTMPESVGEPWPTRFGQLVHERIKQLQTQRVRLLN
jgi:hypothetical protein